MLGQRRRRWANISSTLGQRIVFDRLHDNVRKRWREMNGRQIQTERTEVKQYVTTSVYIIIPTQTFLLFRVRV